MASGANFWNQLSVVMFFAFRLQLFAELIGFCLTYFAQSYCQVIKRDYITKLKIFFTNLFCHHAWVIYVFQIFYRIQWSFTTEALENSTCIEFLYMVVLPMVIKCFCVVKTFATKLASVLLLVNLWCDAFMRLIYVFQIFLCSRKCIIANVTCLRFIIGALCHLRITLMNPCFMSWLSAFWNKFFTTKFTYKQIWQRCSFLVWKYDSDSIVLRFPYICVHVIVVIS